MTIEMIPARQNLTIAEYCKWALKTNKFNKSAQFPMDDPMLGFFGEAGSLLSAVKKRKRDNMPSDKYYETVEEELGDFLWYCAVVCDRASLDLRVIVEQSANSSVRRQANLRFSDVQDQFRLKNKASIDRLTVLLISLAGAVGDFCNYYSRHKTKSNREALQGHMVPVMKALLRVSSAAGIELQNAAQKNLMKIFDRWPEEYREYPDLLDEDHYEYTEKLPRQLDIVIEQRVRRNKPYVFQSCNDINIGDPLTDNIRDEDNYRFHDVFHYAYAAILGWSPVTRALFKLKRKSDPDTDEAEDGARAILIEEGLSTMIFNQAKKMRFFEEVKCGELSYDTLKMVGEFVAGYEVADRPLWLWEEAILEGYKCFRYLVKHKKGVVTLDLEKRTIDISELSS